jgi:hypothetical protein
VENLANTIWNRDKELTRAIQPEESFYEFGTILRRQRFAMVVVPMMSENFLPAGRYWLLKLPASWLADIDMWYQCSHVTGWVSYPSVLGLTIVLDNCTALYMYNRINKSIIVKQNLIDVEGIAAVDSSSRCKIYSSKGGQTDSQLLFIFAANMPIWLLVKHA